jgi:hypothetical protein
MTPSGSNLYSVDIVALLAERIREYNPWQKELNELFESPRDQHLPLEEILLRDAEELAALNPQLRKILPYVSFEEYNGNLPGATSTQIVGEEQWIVSINRKLIHLVHAFHGVAFLLTRFRKTDQLLPKYRELVCSDEWDDHRLWLALVKDIEDFYQPASFTSMRTSGYQFLHEPYEYCFAVLTTRKFIVAHELSHILLGHHTLLGPDGTHPSPEEQRQLEYEADLMALEIVLRSFEHRELSNHDLILLDGAVFGILATFSMFSYAERLLGWHGDDHSHPSPFFRKLHALKFLHNHPTTDFNGRRANLSMFQNLQSFNNRLFSPITSFPAPSARSVEFIREVNSLRRRFNIFAPDRGRKTEAETHLAAQFCLLRYGTSETAWDAYIRSLGIENGLQLTIRIPAEFLAPNCEAHFSEEKDALDTRLGTKEDFHTQNFSFTPDGDMMIDFLIALNADLKRVAKFIQATCIRAMDGEFIEFLPEATGVLQGQLAEIETFLNDQLEQARSQISVIRSIYNEELAKDHDPFETWQ